MQTGRFVRYQRSFCTYILTILQPGPVLLFAVWSVDVYTLRRLLMISFIAILVGTFVLIRVSVMAVNNVTVVM